MQRLRKRQLAVRLRDLGITKVRLLTNNPKKIDGLTRYGINVVGSEVIGLVPMEALIDTAAYYLGLEDFSMEQVLEYRIYE